MSNDVKLLTDKIEKETTSVVKKVEETREWMADHAEYLFTRKFTWVMGGIIGAIPILYAIVIFLQGLQVKAMVLAAIALVGGVIILGVTWIISTRVK